MIFSRSAVNNCWIRQFSKLLRNFSVLMNDEAKWDIRQELLWLVVMVIIHTTVVMVISRSITMLYFIRLSIDDKISKRHGIMQAT
jgi:hypothetical protein